MCGEGISNPTTPVLNNTFNQMSKIGCDLLNVYFSHNKK